MSYKKLEIWQLARDVVIEVHKMTLEKLPRFEMYEEGSQIRRSTKTVKSAIVEGYGRRRYHQDYIRYLIIALSSNDESIDHLENLYETESLKDEELYLHLHGKLETLGKKLNLFIQSIEHRIQSQEKTIRARHPAPGTQHPVPSARESSHG